MRGEVPLGQVAGVFVLLSLVSFGGASALVPELQRQVVGVRGWMEAADFAQLFAIAQAAPGPNIMLTSLIGWRVAGLPGMAVATAAALGPTSVIAFVFGRLFARTERPGFGRIVRQALSRVGVALLLGSGLLMSRQAGASPLGAAICSAAAAAVLFTRRNPVWSILGGAAIGGLAWVAG